MAEGGKNSIGKFDCYSDPSSLGKRWKRWLTSFELFADGKGLIIQDDKDDNKQRRRALLLHLAGPDVQDVFLTLTDTGGVKDYAKAVEALNGYFAPQVNPAYARHSFRQMQQKPGETIQQFATRLRKAAQDCDYGTDMDNQIRDEIMCKCHSNYIRRKLLEEGQGLTLKRTLEIAEQCEKVEAQMTALSSTEEGELSSVNKVVERKVSKETQQGSSPAKCYRCGRTGHFGRDPTCPARGKTCNKCKGKDHFAAVCKTKGSVNCVGEEPPPNNVDCVQESKSANREYNFNVNDGINSNMINILIGA